MRFFLGTGMTSQYDTGFTTFGYRLAYHDLADPPNGIPELLQLQFLDARLRYDHGRRALTLDALTFAELAQIHPLRRFDAHPSWRLRAFGTRLHDRAAPDAFAHGADAALGAAVATRDERLVAFLMADAYVGFAGQIDGIGGGFIRAGIGPLAGLRAHLFGETVALVTGTASYLPAQSLTGTFDVRASLRTRLGAHVAMGLEGAGQPRAMELQLGTYLYF